MVFRPDGKPDWTVILAIVAAATALSGAVWWGATLSSASTAHEAQITVLQSTVNSQMNNLQSILTTQGTLLQSESIELSKLGQKLDDLESTMSLKPTK